MKLKHFKELDGIRAIAALMVMFFHFFATVDSQDEIIFSIKKYTILGQTGVSLFFVLSGFLITRILLSTKQSDFYFKNFYVRRALRIFPLYYLFLIIFYFLIPVLENSPIVPFGQQFWYWIYLQNLPMTFRWKHSGPEHFWSLAIEEHFYLFWPVLIYYLNVKRITNSILFIIAFAFVVRLILVSNHDKVFYFTFSRIDELSVGALLAIWELKGRLTPKNLKRFVLLFCSILGPTLILWTFTGGLGFDAIQITKFIVLAFFYFSFIGLILTLNENSWLRKFFKLKPLSYTGKISYGLYVFHPLCFGLVATYYKTTSIIISLLLSFVLCYLVASMSYYFFESKFLLIKKKFEYN